MGGRIAGVQKLKDPTSSGDTRLGPSRTQQWRVCRRANAEVPVQGHQSRYKIMMQGLFYPAVVGTVFVLTITTVASPRCLSASICDLTVFFSVLLIGYCSLSYLTNHFTPAEHYGPVAFAIDVAEITLVLLAFWAMGFVGSTVHHAHMSILYFLLAPIPILERFWNIATRQSGYGAWPGVCGVVALLLAGGIVGHQWPLFNLGVLIGIWALLAWWWRNLER